MTPNLHEKGERLWIPVMAPVLWAIHFTLCYITVALWCGRFGAANAPGGIRTIVGVYTIVVTAGIVMSFVHGLRRHAYQLPAKTHDDDTPEDRRHFLAFTTMLLAGLSLLATLYGALAIMLVDGCA